MAESGWRQDKENRHVCGLFPSRLERHAAEPQGGDRHEPLQLDADRLRADGLELDSRRNPTVEAASASWTTYSAVRWSDLLGQISPIAGSLVSIESGEIVTIQEGTNHAFGYRPSKATTTFDPTSALEISPGNMQPPALRMVRETGHANYGNFEERDVIEDVETPAANKIGEPTRTNYDGTPVGATRPTCVTK